MYAGSNITCPLEGVESHSEGESMDLEKMYDDQVVIPTFDNSISARQKKKEAKMQFNRSRP